MCDAAGGSQGLQGVRAFHVTTAGKAGMGQPLPPQEPIKKELEETDELTWDDGSGHYVEGCLDEWVIMDKVRPRNSNPPHRFRLSALHCRYSFSFRPLQPLSLEAHKRRPLVRTATGAARPHAGAR